MQFARQVWSRWDRVWVQDLMLFRTYGTVSLMHTISHRTVTVTNLLRMVGPDGTRI